MISNNHFYLITDTFFGREFYGFKLVITFLCKQVSLEVTILNRNYSDLYSIQYYNRIQIIISILLIDTTKQDMKEAGSKGDKVCLLTQEILVNSARGVMVIVAGCGHGDTSSNPGPDWLHFS